MSRRWFQAVCLVVLIFAALTPLENYFDSWDRNQPPANDTEFQVTALFIGAGFVLVLPKLVRRIAIAAAEMRPTSRPASPPASLPCFDRAMPTPSASPPPLLLRI